MKWAYLCLFLVCAGSVSSQATVHAVVPPAFESVEAPNSVFWALSPYRARRQLLLDESHLPGLRGATLKALWLRSNTGDLDPRDAGEVEVDISLSHAVVAARDGHPVLRLNRGRDVKMVFQGRVSLPAVPAPTRHPAPWNVEIRFRRPFVYRGGTLCIETVTRPVIQRGNTDPVWWPIDAITSAVHGGVRTIGSSCIKGMGVHSAGADAGSMTPGSTATFFLRGNGAPGPAINYLGLSSKRWSGGALPLDLAAFRAPGCHVYVSLDFPELVQLSPAPQSRFVHGVRSVPIPNDPGFVGLAIYSQWVVPSSSNSFGLTTSNGVEAVVGAAAAVDAVAWIEAPGVGKPSGWVRRGRSPVLRIEATR